MVVPDLDDFENKQRKIDSNLGFVLPDAVDKGHFGSYMKICDFTLLFMILLVELRLNKGSLVRPRLVDQVNRRVHH